MGLSFPFKMDIEKNNNAIAIFQLFTGRWKLSVQFGLCQNSQKYSNLA